MSMVIYSLIQEQQYMCFLFQGYGVNQHLVPTFLNVEFCHQTPFYGTF